MDLNLFLNSLPPPLPQQCREVGNEGCGSVLELDDFGSVRHRGGFQELLRSHSCVPACPAIDKTLTCKPSRVTLLLRPASHRCNPTLSLSGNFVLFLLFFLYHIILNYELLWTVFILSSMQWYSYHLAVKGWHRNCIYQTKIGLEHVREPKSPAHNSMHRGSHWLKG